MQGCSVLFNSGIIQDVVDVQGVFEQFQAHVFDMVGSENVESKAAQFGEDVRIGSNARLVFAESYISDIVIAILYVPMIAYALTKGFGAESSSGDIVGSLMAWVSIGVFCI